MAALAIVVGVLPGVLNVPSTPLRIGAAVVSIMLSVTSMVMLARSFKRHA